MYTFASRIRYSETDPQKLLKIEYILDYFQDCSTFQSEDLGIGLDYLEEHHYAWLINYWQVDIFRRPELGETVRIGTSPYELKGFMGLRNFILEKDALDGSSETLAVANSVWSLMDMERMLPVRVPQIMKDKYTVYPKFDMEYTPRKIAVPERGDYDGGDLKTRTYLVDENMLDSNHHVNNAQYVRLALGMLPEQADVGRLRVEYRRQAHLGECITMMQFATEGTSVIALKADDGQTYAVVECSCR